MSKHCELPGSLALVLTLALMAPPAAAAGLYKWVGADGSVTYSDKPQPVTAEPPTSVVHPAPKAAANPHEATETHPPTGPDTAGGHNTPPR